MADIIQTVQGIPRKFIEQAGYWTEVVAIGDVNVGVLAKGGTPCEIVTCTNADTDTPASGPIPAGTKYIKLQGTSAFVVALGTATSATVGYGISTDELMKVTLTGVAADDTLHVQSPTAGTKVRITYLTK